MRVKPFAALRPAKDAAAVAELPYDVVTTAEAAEKAVPNPRSFFHVSRSEVDMPPGTDPYSDAVYRKAAENLSGFEKDGVLAREKAPSLYIYRMSMAGHSQGGIVGCFHVGDYEDNVIRKHEKTREDKEEDRARHIRILNANAEPVLLFHRDDCAVDSLVAGVEKTAPLFSFDAADGISQALWRVPDPAGLVAALGRIPAAYIADGHHRAAAAARVGAEKRAANRAHSGDEEYNWFLAVIFPAGRLKIMAYNRVVKDLNGMSETTFLARVRDQFEVAETGQQAPTGPGRAAMCLGGKWYEIAWPAKYAAGNPPKLDVTVLQERLLGPILGIDNPRTSDRIEFVGGVKGTGELARLVAGGARAVAFSMHPVSVNDIMAYSDAGLIMPPKSTWFEPKLRSGLFVHTL